MMEFVSWDDDIPNIWKNEIHVPNHQPGFPIFEFPPPPCTTANIHVYWDTSWIYVEYLFVSGMYRIYQIFTLWLFNIAMENGPFIDGLPGFTY
jgi:hypothetical protein